MPDILWASHLDISQTTFYSLLSLIPRVWNNEVQEASTGRELIKDPWKGLSGDLRQFHKHLRIPHPSSSLPITPELLALAFFPPIVRPGVSGPSWDMWRVSTKGKCLVLSCGAKKKSPKAQSELWKGKGKKGLWGSRKVVVGMCWRGQLLQSDVIDFMGSQVWF